MVKRTGKAARIVSLVAKYSLRASRIREFEDIEEPWKTTLMVEASIKSAATGRIVV